ncbi:hypothetical protein [Actinomycetospora termitidis]|uniref:Uncharacterized protein n=1 Tax=Actinomycetospora termitidis TaxID=3053470 RepID=A0ABT7MDD4_9PSEU|nr:hypothetical protein [Actinomycetospora sp. Odt1-22]MDL5158679.1 hypothetical protein [Actinomycetospora sp. Odt1-22]
MQVVAVVPAWMLADGEYVGLAVGDAVSTGFALQVTATVPDGAGVLAQDADRPGLTTVGGRTVTVGRTTVLCCSPWVLALLASRRVDPDVDLSVEGWLTVEPYLWAPGSELADAEPEGRSDWTVTRLRAVGEEAAHDIDRLPAVDDVDPDAVYVVDLSR